MTDVKPVKVKITEGMPVLKLPKDAGYAMRKLATVFDADGNGVFSKKEAEEFNNWNFTTKVKDGKPVGEIEATNRKTNTTIILKFDPDKAEEQLEQVNLYKNNFGFAVNNGGYANVHGLEEGATVSVDLTNQKMELNNANCDWVEVLKDASVELNDCEVEELWYDNKENIEYDAKSTIGKWINAEG